MGSGSEEENDVTEHAGRSQVTKQVEEMSDDDDSDDDDDDEDESEGVTSVSALTVGDLIQAMKTKTKTAAPSQPSSVVNNLSVSL